MAIEIINVDSVDRTATRVRDLTRFLISGTTLGFPSRSVQYLTVNRWRALLCERAKEDGRFVQVTWENGRFGRELVDVELA